MVTEHGYHKYKLWKFFIPMIIWSLLIFISSSIPGDALPEISFWSWDKWVHMAIFGILAVCVLTGFESAAIYHGKSRNWVIFWSLLFCLAYGASDEWHQWFVPNRSCEWLDFMADGIGAAAVHFLYVYNLYPFGYIRTFIHARIEPVKRAAV